MADIRIELSAPEAVARFREIVEAIIECHGQLTEEACAYPDRKGEAIEVHPLDVQRTIDEMLGLAEGQSPPTQASSVSKQVLRAIEKVLFQQEQRLRAEHRAALCGFEHRIEQVEATIHELTKRLSSQHSTNGRPESSPARSIGWIVPQLPGMQETLTDGISALALTRDATRLVVGSGAVLIVWDLETARCLRTLKGHAQGVQAVAVTWDGQRAVSAGADWTVRTWDLSSGQCLQMLRGHKQTVRTVAITSDARHIVSGSDDKTVRVWSGQTERCLRTLQGHKSAARCLSLSPDGRRAASGSADAYMGYYGWPMPTGTRGALRRGGRTDTDL